MAVSPSALTASELEVQVRELVGDYITFEATAPDSLDPQTWSSQQIYDSLNFAIKQYCKATRASFRQLTSDLDSDGAALIPTSYLDVEHVIFPGQANGAKPKYIRIAEMATGWTSDAIYLIRDGAIWVWDANTLFEYQWCLLPQYSSDSWIYDLQISENNLHLLTQKIITADANGDHGESIQTTRYTRPLDGSSGWTQDEQWGWVQWWGPGWNDLYCEVSLTFAGGKTWYVGDFQWHKDPSYQRGGRSWISGEGSSSFMEWRPQFGVYYASADRTLIGGVIGAGSSSVMSSDRTVYITTGGGYRWIHLLGGNRYIYWSDSAGVHAASAVRVGDRWQLTDHVYPGAALSSVPPIPFADRSLLMLDDRSGLWWDGTMFTRDALGTSSSILEPARYRKASWTASAGVATTLRDGSVLHVCAEYSNGFGIFGTFGDE